MSYPAIRLSKVSKKYSAADVLHEIDLDVESGSILGLTGLNGAGKTTLIKCLLDFCDVDSGSIRIQGIDTRKYSSRSRLSYLPERFTAPYFLTGREFVRTMMGLSLCQYNEKRTCAMFEALDLDLTALEKPILCYSSNRQPSFGSATRAQLFLPKINRPPRAIFSYAALSNISYNFKN